MDINVGDITRQYLDYIRLMKELDLEVAGEFVAMAATLIQIKSRMLLPSYDETGEVVETEDPRRELVQKLLDYQKYQEAAKKLYGRPLLNRDIYSRGVREDLRDEDSLTAVSVEEEGLFSLIASYRRIIRKAQNAVHQVRPKVQSIAARVSELRGRLIMGVRTTLRELLAAEAPEVSANGLHRTKLLVTFLSMLELGRMGFVSIFQSETYGDIHIDTIRMIEANVLERVQEFDSGDSASVASAIINNAIDDKIDMYETMMSEADEVAASGEQLPLIDALPLGEEHVEASDMELFEGADVASDDEIAAAEAELAAAGGLAPADDLYTHQDRKHEAEGAHDGSRLDELERELASADPEERAPRDPDVEV